MSGVQFPHEAWGGTPITCVRVPLLLQIQEYVCSLSQHLLRVCSVPGSVLGSGDRAISQKLLGLALPELPSVGRAGGGSAGDKQADNCGLCQVEMEAENHCDWGWVGTTLDRDSGRLLES